MRVMAGGKVDKGCENGQRDEHHNEPIAFLHYANRVTWVSRGEGTRMDMNRDVRYASTH